MSGASLHSLRKRETFHQPAFETSLRLSTYLFLLCGFTALLISEAVGFALGILYFLAAAASWGFEFKFGKRAQVVAVSILLMGFLVDLALFSGFIEATLHLLIFLSLVKLFGESGNRDYQLVYSISFVFLLIASAYTISVLFLFALVVYVFFGNLTFILFESRRAYRENRSAFFSLFGYLKVAILMTILIGVIATPVFLAFPRSALGFLRGDAGLAGLHLSGFSDHVNLGDLGRVITDPRVFMRIRVEGQVDFLPELRWRGVALDHYDGKAWKNTEKSYRYIQKNPATRSFEVARTLAVGESNLRQYFNVSSYSNLIFSTGRVLQVFNVPGETIRQDEQGGLTYLWSRRVRIQRYVVDSGVVSRAVRMRQVREGIVPDEIRERYLQLPDLDPRVAELANRQTLGQSSALGKALTLERFLKSSFDYTLENPSGGAVDPVSDFLFSARAGHCEYFATAQALMLRTLGIPSRVVNGFRLGEYNEWNDSYIVRHSDAHSWTEAYFPGAGWIAFDPTPATAFGEFGDLLRFARQFLDAVDVFWLEVITFDRLKQVGFFVTLAGDLREVSRSLRENSERAGLFLTGLWGKVRFGDTLRLEMLAVCGLLGGLFWTLARYRSRLRLLWRRRLLRHQGSDAVCGLYLELLDLLKQRGCVRKPSETPLELALRVREELGTRVPLAITDLYYRGRFGGDFPAEKLEEMRTAIRRGF